MLHAEVRTHQSRDANLTSFDLSASINSINPQLWEFICLCTRSIRDRTGHQNSDDAHTKTVRRFFIACMMLFTTNPSCDTVLHHLVAESVEVNGGSRHLMRVLNRLGACVSTDTHDRFVTKTAEEQKKSDLWSELSHSTFTVVSTDNIDWLQSHAAVYCGDQSRSYHATTVQLTQPIPSLKIDQESVNINTTANTSPNTADNNPPQPPISPHPTSHTGRNGHGRQSHAAHCCSHGRNGHGRHSHAAPFCSHRRNGHGRQSHAALFSSHWNGHGHCLVPMIDLTTRK